MNKPIHPAKYSDELIPHIAEWIIREDCWRVADFFSGTGKLQKIREYGYDRLLYLLDLEKEWLYQALDDKKNYNHLLTTLIVGDARELEWFISGELDAIATSVVYGNRMSDSHEAKDQSKRNTYTHCLGRPLSEGNAGRLHYAEGKRGNAYRQLHLEAYREFWRVLKPGGIFILNISNFIAKGEEVDVTSWHVEALTSLGFVEEERKQIKTKRNRQGKNGEKRVEYESLILFRKK